MFRLITLAAALAAAACSQPVSEESSLTHTMLDCGTADPAVCAVDHYTAIVGRQLTEKCTSFVLSTEVRYVSTAEVHATCGTTWKGGAALGCVAGLDSIVIEDSIDGRVPAVAAHELMHQILFCEMFDYNVTHSWRVWTGLRTD